LDSGVQILEQDLDSGFAASSLLSSSTSRLRLRLRLRPFSRKLKSWRPEHDDLSGRHGGLYDLWWRRPDLDHQRGLRRQRRRRRAPPFSSEVVLAAMCGRFAMTMIVVVELQELLSHGVL
jgi:hypothetical protein